MAHSECESSDIISVSRVLHVELGVERTEPDQTAVCPSPAVIVQVCPISEHQLAVVGVASASQCLYSLTVEESSTEVRLSAFVGRQWRSNWHDCIARRVLWVAEVALAFPLGRRNLKATSLGSPIGGENQRMPISEGVGGSRR